MVQKFQSPVRVYKYPFELVMKVKFNSSQFVCVFVYVFLFYFSFHFNQYIGFV